MLPVDAETLFFMKSMLPEKDVRLDVKLPQQMRPEKY
jgi:hypothetical protein